LSCSFNNIQRLRNSNDIHMECDKLDLAIDRGLYSCIVEAKARNNEDNKTCGYNYKRQCSERVNVILQNENVYALS
jgi:hypothetical protein